MDGDCGGGVKGKEEGDRSVKDGNCSTRMQASRHMYVCT